MPGRSIRVARIAGIPVGVSPWLVIVALLGRAVVVDAARRPLGVVSVTDLRRGAMGAAARRPKGAQ